MTDTPKKIRLTRISDIVPFIEQGYDIAYIGRNLLIPKKSKPTMYRYIKKLRQAGYIIPTRRGQPKLEV